MSEFILTREIINLSESDVWIIAKKEWVLEEIYFSNEPETCLCSHYPIKEVCILRNRINRNIAVVGNVCVNKFLGLPSDKIFKVVKKVRNDIQKSLNSEAILHAFEKRWINEWEKDFYISIIGKRNLSEKQTQIKTQINEKMLRNMTR